VGAILLTGVSLGRRDIRKLGEPLESMPLQVGADSATLGGVTLSYDVAAGPTNFLVGTEQGTVLLCKRKSKSPSDRIGAVYPGHHGPIYALQRHPMFPKNFLTVGDWTARIWNDDLKTPIVSSLPVFKLICPICLAWRDIAA
jgi:dynein intermediate chain 2